MRGTRSWALIGLLVASACTDDVEPIGQDDLSTSRLRLIHAAAGAPEVDVWAVGRDAALATSLAYGEATSLIGLSPGSYTIEVRPAGAPRDSTPIYTLTPLELAGNQRVDAVAVGVVGTQDASTAFRIVSVPWQFGEAEAGRTRVRILHAGADAPAIDIDVGNDGSAELQGLARFTATEDEGIALPSDQALQIGIRAQGQPVTAFTTPVLPEGGQLLLIAAGSLNTPARLPGAFSLLEYDVNTQLAQLRQNPTVVVVHASPDAPAVDLFANEAELADNLSFGALSQRIQLAPGSYSLDVFATSPGAARPASAPVATVSTGDLEAGEQYLMVATGFLTPEPGEQALRIERFRSEFDAIDTQPRVRVIHASPDAPNVDVGVVDAGGFAPIAELTNLAFPQASAGAGVVVPEGTVRLGVAATGTTTPVATFDLQTRPGYQAFVIAMGALTPTAGDEALRVVGVDASSLDWTQVNLPNL